MEASIKCIHSDADSVFTFTEFNSFESGELIHCELVFVPANTIECQPPYTEGKIDSCWIKYQPENKPKSKEDLERCLGMSILRWE